MEDITRKDDGSWKIEVKDLSDNLSRDIYIPNLFLLVPGGGSLPLLEKSDIPEGKGFGGFPVSGQWPRCTNTDIIGKASCVYGKASAGAPPMSVPHLDSRFIDGEKALLFGPYACFSTKFLKHGSYMDLPASINLGNIVPMVSAGLDNIPLTKYLIHEVMQSADDKMASLRSISTQCKKRRLGTGDSRRSGCR